MPRRKKQGSAGGGEIDPNAWMTTFADLLMLLLTFFVLLLTMKSMEGEKLQDVVRHVSMSVGPLDYPRSRMVVMEDVAVKPIVVQKKIVRDNPPDQSNEKTADDHREQERAPATYNTIPHTLGPLDYAETRISVLEQLNFKPVVIKQRTDMQERLNEVMGETDAFVGQKSETEVSERLRVYQDNRGVVLSLGVDNLFQSGGADIKADRLYLLDIVGKLLATASNDILVMGHTDATPLRSEQYESNWELSVYRALAVVYYLIDSVGLDENKLAAGGYGSSMPYLPNASPANRAKNRRVEFILKVPKSAS